MQHVRQAWTGAYVHDRRSGERKVVVDVPPEPLSRHEVDALYGAAVVAALEAPVSVLGGPHHASPVPADVYSRLAGDIRNADRCVVADLSGAPLDAVLEGGVDVLKVSHEDLIDDWRAPGDAGPDLAESGRELQRRGATDVVVHTGVMASYSVNERAVARARQLIDARQYVLESEWAEVQPRADAQNAFLDRHGWDEYAAWHLGLTDGATDHSKARYAFVYGDFRRVHRMGLIACQYRAAEWRHKAIELAAHDLLQHLDAVTK
jgi:hypothetical protein